MARCLVLLLFNVYNILYGVRNFTNVQAGLVERLIEYVKLNDRH